jgi:hypothetical protein
LIDFGQRYVLDTNTLIQIGGRRRASDYFKDNVVLSEAVLLEAADFPDIDKLKMLVHPTTSQVLQWLVRVMSTVPAGDMRLVNLYRNKGGADPLLIACALDGQSTDRAFLDPPEWIVVTADDAVRHNAEKFKLRCLSNAEFAAIIDASIPQDGS